MDKNKPKNASEGIAPMGISALNEVVLSDQPESRYECPICIGWLRDPVITTCGHKFCKACITSWLQNSGHCPIDNINLSMKVDIFPDNYTKREIQEQRMSCPFSSKGCKVSATPLDIDAHIASCEHNKPETSSQSVKVPCSFSAIGCKTLFETQDDLNQHLHTDTQNHMSYLMNAYSEMKINRDMSDVSGDGKEQEAMMLWDAPDKNSNERTSNDLPSNTTNTTSLIKALYERVVVLEQRNREQDIVIANLSKQLSAMSISKMKQNNEMMLKYCMGNYAWKIDNFNDRLDAMLKDHYKMLYSPGFYTSPNGYRFCVRLNISPQNPQCFALHVHLMKTENDDYLDWPFNGRITFSMINQVDPDLTQRDTMMSNYNLIAFKKPTTEICVRGFGYTEYAVVSDVINNGFVMNDVFIVRVNIKCV